MKGNHPDKKGSGGTDAGPDRIGRSDGNVPLRQPQEKSAQSHAYYRHDDKGEPVRRGLRQFETQWPTDLQYTSEQKI